MDTYNNKILPETKCHRENHEVNLSAICIIQIQMIVIHITVTIPNLTMYYLHLLVLLIFAMIEVFSLLPKWVILVMHRKGSNKHTSYVDPLLCMTNITHFALIPKH